MKEINLRQVLTTNGMELSRNDIEEITTLICKRCQPNTWDRVRSILTYSPSAIPTYSILERVYKGKHGWRYCAGQSYPDEIRTVRNIIKDLK